MRFFYLAFVAMLLFVCIVLVLFFLSFFFDLLFDFECRTKNVLVFFCFGSLLRIGLFFVVFFCHPEDSILSVTTPLT